MGRAKRERAKAKALLATTRENRDMIRLVPVAVGVHRAVREMQQRAGRVRPTHLHGEQPTHDGDETITHTVPEAQPDSGGGQ